MAVCIAFLLDPSGDAETALSTGAYWEFDDFPHLMQLIESARRSDGERAEKVLGVHPVPVGTMAEVAMEGAALSFEDICFRQTRRYGMMGVP